MQHVVHVQTLAPPTFRYAVPTTVIITVRAEIVVMSVNYGMYRIACRLLTVVQRDKM
jgi:hypothetical protein